MGSALLAGCGESSSKDSFFNTGDQYPEDPSLSSSDAGLASNPEDVIPADEIVINPFVSVAHDPFSTFGADTDTASYEFARRVINDGYFPTPAQVRLEDFVNYFNYAYPTPKHTADVPFEISLAAATHPLGRATQILRVGIQAKAPPPTVKRPANLVFLVDTSGSMLAEDKLPLVQAVLNETLEILDPTDTVSIVTYAGSAGVALKPTPASEKAKIRKVIDAFSAGGSTAGAEGIDAAYAQVEKGFIEGGINHVLLCTDGDFNVGPYTNEELLALVKSKRESGTTLTALGFGTGNYNDGMMELISNAGNGMHGYIGDSDSAIEYVHERMLATLVHVAKDMKIQVEFNPAHVLAYRLLGYENRAIADDQFRDDKVDGGEVGAGHRVTALYEIVPTGGTIPAATGAPAIDDGEPVDGEREIDAEALVEVRLRWKDVTATDDDAAHETSDFLTPADVASDLTKTDEDLLWAAATAGLAEWLQHSPYAKDSELTTIQTIVDAQKAKDDERSEFAELVTKAAAIHAMATQPTN